MIAYALLVVFVFFMLLVTNSLLTGTAAGLTGIFSSSSTSTTTTNATSTTTKGGEEGGNKRSLLLIEYPFLLSHDSASGEVKEERDGGDIINSSNDDDDAYLLYRYAQTQSEGLSAQLDCGVRAFDYRPYLTQQNIVIASSSFSLSSSSYTSRQQMGSSVDDIIAWLSLHPTEFVVLYVSRFSGHELDGASAGPCEEAAAGILASKGVHTVRGNTNKAKDRGTDRDKDKDRDCASQLLGLS